MFFDSFSVDFDIRLRICGFLLAIDEYKNWENKNEVFNLHDNIDLSYYNTIKIKNVPYILP